MSPESFRLAASGDMPNRPDFPVLLCRGAVRGGGIEAEWRRLAAELG